MSSLTELWNVERCEQGAASGDGLDRFLREVSAVSHCAGLTTETIKAIAMQYPKLTVKHMTLHQSLSRVMSLSVN